MEIYMWGLSIEHWTEIINRLWRENMASSFFEARISLKKYVSIFKEDLFLSLFLYLHFVVVQ